MDILNKAREKCIEWHGDQKRKYTGEPYFHHPFEVAEIVAAVTDDPAVIAAAYLHDVIEDTPITARDIVEHFDEHVAGLVLQVTDVSRPEDGNRKIRKALDRDHLAKASADGQTIKLADLISNTSSIVQHDPGFAKVYQKEKADVLAVLTRGDRALHRRASEIVAQPQEQS